MHVEERALRKQWSLLLGSCCCSSEERGGALENVPGRGVWRSGRHNRNLGVQLVGHDLLGDVDNEEASSN